MSKTKPWNSAEYLTTPEMRTAYEEEMRLQYRKAVDDANRMNDKGEIPDTAPADYCAPEKDPA